MFSKRYFAAVVSFASTLSIAATHTVVGDSSSAEADLRAAIAAANSGDTIEITGSSENPTIHLTGVTAFGGDASLAIDKSLTIVGPAGGVTLDGGWNGTLFGNTGTRLVKISGSSTAVTFRNVSFENGNGTYYNNDVRYLQGGAIYAEGPLTLEDCAFRNNVAANVTGNGVYDETIVNGGGAIYAMNGLAIRDCVFANNSTARKNHGYNIRGGAVTVLGGALTVMDSIFTGDSCGSYWSGGAFYIGAGVSSANFSGTVFTDEHTALWGDQTMEGGGAIMSDMASGTLLFDGCSFTNCFTSEHCKGGAIRCEGSVAPIVRNSSFVGCFAGNGGAVRSTPSGALFVNCLFQDNVVAERGAAVHSDYGTPMTLVNCTLVGGVSLKTADGWNSPGAYHTPSLRLVNTVIAYNYLNVSGAPAIRDGEGGFSGPVASLCAYGTDYTASTAMFAAMKSAAKSVGVPADGAIGETTLQGTISVPDGCAIDPEGVLAAGGYPVKMTDDGSYVGYSTDGGSSWSMLAGGNPAKEGEAVPLECDMRGVAYESGKTPIGALCGAAGGEPPDPVDPVAPSIGAATVSVKKTTATLELSGIAKGSDESGRTASSYDVYLAYAESGSALPAASKIATGMSATYAYDIEGLAPGATYGYAVSISNKCGASAVKTGSFDVPETDPYEDAPVALRADHLLESQGWIAAPMTGSPLDIATNGVVATVRVNNRDCLFAYCCDSHVAADDPTIAGVPFHNPFSTDGGSVFESPLNNGTEYYYGDGGTRGSQAGSTGYGKLMTGAWNGNARGTYSFRIMGLEPKATYLVQVIVHNGRSTTASNESGLHAYTDECLKTMSIDGNAIQYGAVNAEDEWYYGGTLLRVFSADRHGEFTFEAVYPDDNPQLNAIQVRKVDRTIPSEKPVAKVAPVLKSATAQPIGSSVAFTFGGLNRGSDANGLMEKNVDVYLSWGPQGSDLPGATKVATTAEASAMSMITGLQPGVYAFVAYAKNGSGESPELFGQFTIAAGADPTTDEPVLAINEIGASNPDSAEDGGFHTDNGRFGLDWVEIRNRSDVAIDITGWYLYDDPTASESKWKRVKGDGLVPANGYKIVWCDKDYEEFSVREAHSRINLSTAGEPLFLATPGGQVVDSVDFPRQVKSISYGLGKLAGSSTPGYVYFADPTFCAANDEFGAGPMTPTVAFSVPHGYKTEPFDVELSCAEDPSAAIYYTTDGTSPTTASTRYTGAIRVDHTTCLRAAVPRENSVLQQDASATYIFLADVLAAGPDTVPAGFPAVNAEGTFNGQAFRYGLIRSFVNDPASRVRLERGFTNSIATVSLVIDPAYLVDPATGIYANAYRKDDGVDDWERRMLIEQIDPVQGAANEFSAPAGLRIRGATSRGGDHAKHAFKVIFRSKYGMGKLAFPLFGDEGTDEFERFDLRCSQNHSWANENAMGETFVHEVFSRDSQRDMGELYTRSRYYNLFINGAYWGLYQSQERGDEDFAASYNGGNPDNYDQVKTVYQNGYRTSVSGSVDGWNALVAASAAGFKTDESYLNLLGLDAHGVRDPSLPALLNPTNLMVFMLSAHYACDSDGPAAPALPNNLYFLRDRVDGDADRDGFFFLRHDAEHSLGVREINPEDQAMLWSQANSDPTGYGTMEIAWGRDGRKPVNGTWEDAVGFNPAELHWKLCKNRIYRRAFGDQFYKHCLRPGGALTEEMSLARFRSRMAEIDDAIVCEAARWSMDAANPKSREDWLAACGYCIDFITNRMPYMVSQYRACGWYPSIDTPEPNVWDGPLAVGQPVTFSCPEGGEVYVTTDGSDPAEAGSVAPSGAVSFPEARVYSVKARALKEGEWSALQEVSYTVAGDGSDGYEFVFSGNYDTVQTVAPTGRTCKIVLTNANLQAGLVLPAGIVAKLNASTNTINSIASISAAGSEVRFTGDGTVRLEGADTLATVSNLIVKSGTLEIKSTGVSATKTPVVNVLGFVEQTGGTIDMDLDVSTANQIYGIFVANKDPKDAAGKNMGVIYALFDGGTFLAKVGATKSSAVYVDKGSVLTTFKGGETIQAELTGVEPRFVSAAGEIEFKRCLATVTMPSPSTALTGARVFKSDKKITITDGHYDVNVPGPDAEIFSSADRITIDDGVFELVAEDDCFSALNRIKVNGGLFYAVSLANDVFDSNGDMEINGGTILAYATASGHEAFDVDPEATEAGEYVHQLRINGGTIFATGGKSADWPDNLVCGTGVTLFQREDLGASGFSGKYLSLHGAADLRYTARLPALPQSQFAILATCPGFDGTTTQNATPPQSGSQNFHDFYIESETETYQDQLRFLQIYGSTDDGVGGDTGEYMILTNVSDHAVQLEGVTVSSAKYDSKKDKIDDPKCLITLGAGTVPAHGSVRLDQADYASAGWAKITNGKIFVRILDATGAEVQSGHASFDNAKYPGSDMGGSALLAIRFPATMEDSTDYWTSVPVPKPAPAPVIGAVGANPPMEIGDTNVLIRISNAAADHRYGYLRSPTLVGLATAEPVFLCSAEEAGELVLSIPRETDETSCFYRIVVWQ